MPEFLTIEIVKGAAGFGFTIADSSYGQKVCFLCFDVILLCVLEFGFI